MVEQARPLKVLLINDDEDDSYILQEVAELFFEKMSLENIHPHEKILESLQPYNVPDVVLLDLFISKVNGVDVLKQIRSTRHLKNLPVIIYSGRQHSSIIKKCFDLGATAFVEKPHTYKGVERILRKILERNWGQYKVNAKEHDFILQTEDY